MLSYNSYYRLCAALKRRVEPLALDNVGGSFFHIFRRGESSPNLARAIRVANADVLPDSSLGSRSLVPKVIRKWTAFSFCNIKPTNKE